MRNQIEKKESERTEKLKGEEREENCNRLTENYDHFLKLGEKNEKEISSLYYAIRIRFLSIKTMYNSNRKRVNITVLDISRITLHYYLNHNLITSSALLDHHNNACPRTRPSQKITI